MIDGRLARGRDHAAGQIAHMPMPGATGRCLCSRQGCLDTLASGRAILACLGRVSAHANPAHHGSSDAQSLREAAASAERGEPTARAAFHTAGTHLGTAMQWAAAALQPELVVLAGVAAHCSAYVDGVRQTYADAQAVPVLVSRITNEAAAGELALDSFVYSDGFELGTAPDEASNTEASVA
jgi:glucokinase